MSAIFNGRSNFLSFQKSGLRSKQSGLSVDAVKAKVMQLLNSITYDDLQHCF